MRTFGRQTSECSNVTNHYILTVTFEKFWQANMDTLVLLLLPLLTNRYVSLSLSLFLSFSLCVSLSVSVCACVCVGACVRAFLSLSLSLSLPPFLSRARALSHIHTAHTHTHTHTHTPIYNAWVCWISEYRQTVDDLQMYMEISI